MKSFPVSWFVHGVRTKNFNEIHLDFPHKVHLGLGFFLFTAFLLSVVGTRGPSKRKEIKKK